MPPSLPSQQGASGEVDAAAIAATSPPRVPPPPVASAAAVVLPQVRSVRDEAVEVLNALAAVLPAAPEPAARR